MEHVFVVVVAVMLSLREMGGVCKLSESVCEGAMVSIDIPFFHGVVLCSAEVRDVWHFFPGKGG